MDFLLILFTIIVGGTLCVYLFGCWNYNDFNKAGIPIIKPTPFIGNMGGVISRTKGMHEVIQEAYDLNHDAKYVGLYEFSSPIIVLKDPELVKLITIKKFDSFPDHKMFTESTEPLLQKSLMALKGDAWKDMRALLSPAFTSSKMKMMFEILSECAEDFSDHLAKQNPQPENLDMKDTFGRYTLDVIASAAFGLSVNSMKYRDNDFYRMGREMMDMSASKMLKFFVMKNFRWLAKLMNLKFISTKTTSFFINAIKTTIATRDAQGIIRPDMIQLMMQARDKKDSSSLTLEDMTAQALVFLLGGFDSPATTMSFAAHLLALNPDVQKKLQAEIDQVLKKNSGKVSYEDLHAMKYLDAVVSETLRMYPPSPILDRVGPKSFTLPPALEGLKPFEIKTGQNIWIPIYSFHNDPKYFPEPENFDPERFSENNKSKINPLTYLPFGIGPRICIANRFALMEVKLALFHLLAKCNLLPTSKTQSPIKLTSKSILLMPEGGFLLKLEPRM